MACFGTPSSSDNQVLANSSIDFYSHVQEDKVDVGLQVLGYLWLVGEAQLSKSEPFIGDMEKRSIEVVRYGRETLRGMLPGIAPTFDSGEQAKLMDLPSVEGGIFGPKCGRLDPDKLVR